MGRDLLLPGRARRHAAGRLGDRAHRQGGTGPRRPGERLPAHDAACGTGQPLHRGAGGQQPRHPAILFGGAPLRADGGRRATLDVARAGTQRGRPGRAVREFHLRLRDDPGDAAASAPPAPEPHPPPPPHPLPPPPPPPHPAAPPPPPPPRPAPPPPPPPPQPTP